MRPSPGIPTVPIQLGYANLSSTISTTGKNDILHYLSKSDGYDPDVYSWTKRRSIYCRSLEEYRHLSDVKEVTQKSNEMISKYIKILSDFLTTETPRHP